MSDSKNDIAWQKLFAAHAIADRVLQDGYFHITAEQINHAGREARLMTKFDHRSQLPQLFAEHKLGILPVSRGSYVIAPFETFCAFNTGETAITKIGFPPKIESLDYRHITSEATAINCAFVTGILHHFTGEKTLWPTVSGRMGSSVFDFTVDATHGPFTVSVQNAQVEIDGGYEGEHALYLLEAKNYISNDFLIRQLYYPYRLWQAKMKKPVRPLFLTYTNGIFHLREYAFDAGGHYNSVQLVKQAKYIIQDSVITRDTVQQIVHEIQTVQEPQTVPFPQADSFARIINLCELLKEKEALTAEDITQNYDFDARQTGYYTNACKYLGLVGKYEENGQSVFKLTEKGKAVFNLPLADRQLEFMRLILAHKAFNETLRAYLPYRRMPGRDEIVTIMQQSGLYNVDSPETYKRRASTIISWLNWIISCIDTPGNKSLQINMFE